MAKITVKAPIMSSLKNEAIADRIWRAKEDKADSKEGFGISAGKAGEECQRAVWYRLRWMVLEKFEGRMLRLFETGHIQEARVVQDLKDAGYLVRDIDPDTGKQWRIAGLTGWIRGKTDGFVSGQHLPPGEGVLEVKTHNKRSFAELENAKAGVRYVKPEHFAQMQLYMKFLGKAWTLYVAVDKDDDDIYPEIVHYDAAYAEDLERKLDAITTADKAPPRISEREGYGCKFCPFKGICFGQDLPRKHCRSCAHVTLWKAGPELAECSLKPDLLDINDQKAGCDRHLYNPSAISGTVLTEKRLKDGTFEVVYRRPDGSDYVNVG